MGYASHQKAALKEMTKDEKTNINNFNNNGINADDRVSIDTLILGGKNFMLKIIGLVICVMLSVSAVGCTDNNNTTVEESSTTQEVSQKDKDINEAYEYVVKKYDNDEDKDDMVYKIEKTSDGVVIKMGLVSESDFKEAVMMSSIDYSVEQLEESLEPFNELPGYVEVEARKEGINTENVNFYMEVYLYNNKKELTDLLYSISSKDGVILNSIKHQVEYYKDNQTSSDNKSKENNSKSQQNNASNKNNNTNSDDTRTSEEKHWDKHNSDQSKAPTTVVLHKCAQCGTEHIQSDMFKNNGKWYCNDCGLMYCSECGRRVYPKWLKAPSSMDYMHYQNDGNGDIVCGYCYRQD